MNGGTLQKPRTYEKRLIQYMVPPLSTLFITGTTQISMKLKITIGCI